MTTTRISYTNKEFADIRDALITRIPYITDKWTDFNKSDLGITLIELFCGIADMLLFYLDHQANEAFLSTARERKNVLKHARMLGYKMESLTAASSTVNFTISTPHNKNIILPKYTRLKGANKLEYLTIENAVITAGTTESGPVNAKQGVKSSVTFIANGSPNFSYKLPSNTIAEGSIEVIVGESEEVFTEELSLIDSLATDTHYSREIDADNYQTLYFGDGVRGVRLEEGVTVVVNYINTSGYLGNIGGNLVNAVLDIIYDSEGDPVQVGVSNLESFTGGSDRETIEEAKIQAPAELATLDRQVVLSDYVALINGYPGVLKCQATDVNDDPTYPFRYVLLHVIPEGGNQISEVLRKELTAFIDDRIMVGNIFEFADVVYVPINIEVAVYVEPAWKNRLNSIRSAIVNELDNYLSIDSRSIGEAVRYSKLAALIQDCEGVAYIELITPSEDVILKNGEIATAGDFVINIYSIE